jgi:hypothetical protein
MDFPTSEPQIMALSDRMFNGYFWHAADFPNVNRFKLMSRRNAYIFAKRALVQAQANLRIETRNRKSRLEELKRIMKNCLRRATVDVVASPEKLKLIGWAPKNKPQPAEIPAQPLNLLLAAREDRNVLLEWDRPAGGGPVRNYLIERRVQNNGNCEDWTIVRISYKTRTSLRNQPQGVRFEYRVKAANNAGTGPLSNAISLVL